MPDAALEQAARIAEKQDFRDGLALEERPR